MYFHRSIIVISECLVDHAVHTDWSLVEKHRSLYESGLLLWHSYTSLTLYETLKETESNFKSYITQHEVKKSTIFHEKCENRIPLHIQDKAKGIKMAVPNKEGTIGWQSVQIIRIDFRFRRRRAN